MTKPMQALLVKLATSEGCIYVKAKGQVAAAQRLKALDLVNATETIKGLRVDPITLVDNVTY